MFPRRLAYYFIKTWARLGLLILLVLLSLSFVVVFSDQLRDFAHAEVSWQVALWLIVYQLPGLIALVMPMAVFLSQVLGLDHFYQTREMVAFYAFGGSRLQLALIMAGYGLVMALLLWGITGWWVPHTDHLSRKMLMVAAHQISDDAWPVKTFYNLDNHWFAYSEHEKDGDKKRFFLVHDNEDSSEDVIIMRGVMQHEVDQGSGHRLIKSSLALRYHGTPGQRDYTISQATDSRWSLLPRDKILAKKDKSVRESWPALYRKRHQSDAAWSCWQNSNAPMIAMVVASLFVVVLVRLRLRSVQWLQVMTPLAAFMLYQGALFIAQSSSFLGWWHLGLWWVHGGALLAVALVALKAWWRHEH